MLIPVAYFVAYQTYIVCVLVASQSCLDVYETQDLIPLGPSCSGILQAILSKLHFLFHENIHYTSLKKYFNLFIHLTALGLSCCTQDL